MPIVDGRYEAKLGTKFKKVEDGIEEIKRRILRSRGIRIDNIPTTLLDELRPHLKGKDLKIILPLGAKATGELKELGEVGVTNSRIYTEYDGEEANSGSVAFADVVFNIPWLDGRVLEISTMEYSKCVKCLRETFEGAWRYAKK
ncbi:hypothetical protein [[Eubacterium] cellulosolvens]